MIYSVGFKAIVIDNNQVLSYQIMWVNGLLDDPQRSMPITFFGWSMLMTNIAKQETYGHWWKTGAWRQMKDQHSQDA